jgi:hypothetical protein
MRVKGLEYTIFNTYQDPLKESVSYKTRGKIVQKI